VVPAQRPEMVTVLGPVQPEHIKQLAQWLLTGWFPLTIGLIVKVAPVASIASGALCYIIMSVVYTIAYRVPHFKIKVLLYLVEEKKISIFTPH